MYLCIGCGGALECEPLNSSVGEKEGKNEGEDVVLYRGDIILRSEAPWSKNNGNIYGAQRRAASGGGAGAAGKDHPSGGAAAQN